MLANPENAAVEMPAASTDAGENRRGYKMRLTC